MKLTLIFLSFFLFSNAQTNLEKRDILVHAAQVYLYQSKYNESLNCFKKAFKYAKAESSYDLLTAASIALRLKKNTLANSFLKESITKYKAPLEFINTYDRLLPYKNTKTLIKINNDYNKFLSQYYGQLSNPDIYIEIEKMHTKDQFVRNLKNYYLGADKDTIGLNHKKYIDAINRKDTINIKKFKKYHNFEDSEFETFNNRIQINTDSINISRYIEITKTHGYYPNGWILLWHQRISYGDKENFVWNFFKPYIYSEIQKGNIEKSFFAQFEDAYYMSKNGKQIYGTQQNYEIFPIENIESIDERRNHIGLPPLYYDKIIYGVDLPKEYYIKEKVFFELIFSKIKNL